MIKLFITMTIILLIVGAVAGKLTDMTMDKMKK